MRLGSQEIGPWTWPHSGALSKWGALRGRAEAPRETGFSAIQSRHEKQNQRAKLGQPQNAPNSWPVSESSGLFSSPSLGTRPGLREGHSPPSAGRSLSESWRLQETGTEPVTCTELLGRNGVRAVADGVPGRTRVSQLLAVGGLEDSNYIPLFPQGTPAICDILFFFLHRACQGDITGAVSRCH